MKEGTRLNFALRATRHVTGRSPDHANLYGRGTVYIERMSQCCNWLHYHDSNNGENCDID